MSFPSSRTNAVTVRIRNGLLIGCALADAMAGSAESSTGLTEDERRSRLVDLEVVTEDERRSRLVGLEAVTRLPTLLAASARDSV